MFDVKLTLSLNGEFPPLLRDGNGKQAKQARCFAGIGKTPVCHGGVE